MIRRTAIPLSTAIALLTVPGAAFAATPASLVRDLRHQPGPNLSSNPSTMVSLGNLALFRAHTPLLGYELYRTDGTAEGTSLVADLCPGSCDSISSEPPIAIAGRAFFLATDGARGNELWTSDGTLGGTRPLLDLDPGPAEGFYLSLFDGGDRLLFETFGPPFGGLDFWSSDGTVAGTVRYAHLAEGPDGGILVPGDAAPGGPLPGGRRLYRRNFNRSGSVDELWESDGTAAGTRRVLALSFDAGELICSDTDDLPRVVAGDFYFAVSTGAIGCELWRVAGGVAAPFADLGAGDASSNPRSFVRQGAWTLFVADRADGKSELWTTDGTLERTLPAAPAGSPVGTSPAYLGSNSAGAYFAADTPEQGRELWRTSGPPGEFRPLGDFVPGAGSSDPQRAGVVGDRVYFWTSHPDRGIELNAAVPGGVGSVARVREREFRGSLAGAGEWAVFGADLGQGVGVELAVTNGFPGSIGLLRDLADGDPSSYPLQLTRVAGRVLFSATDDAHGREIWRSDGTNAGTERVADLTPGRNLADFPVLLAPTASGVVLEAPDGSIRHARARGGIDLLFRPASELKAAHVGFRLGARGLFFVPAGDAENPRFELWRADGRPEGNRRLADLSGFDRYFGYTVSVAVDPPGRRAFFIPQVIEPEFGPSPVGLWITDGTVAGTRRVLASPCNRCGDGIGDSIVGPGGSFFFEADDLIEDVSRLWVSDGTSTASVILAESPNLIDGDPIRSLARLGEKLLFAASDPEHGQELWVSDGTPAGTRLLADLRPGTAPSWPDGITVVGSLAFFSADDGIAGRELWATDGTEEGTYRVADIRRGTRSSVPQALTALGNRLVFAADDGKRGLEVWSSDGTAAGTRLASDVQVGRLPSSPSDFLALGSDLLFVASRLTTGRELFRLPLAALGAP